LKRSPWQRKDQIPHRHGWNLRHYFVKGSSICNKWTTDLRCSGGLDNRKPRFVDHSSWRKRDCVVCTRGWLELYANFKEITDNRILP